jgi:HD-like signal output (HDOD) protein
LKEVRAEAIEHARIARNLARELGVTREAIQKMIAAGQE